MTKASKKSGRRPKNGQPKEHVGDPTAERGHERDHLPRVLTGPQCTAKRANGLPCKNRPIKGGTVCRIHGGGAKQVKAKAQDRLFEMVMPALNRLRKIVLDPATSDADALRAIREVLNRTGFTERFAIDIAPDDKWTRLLDAVGGDLTTDRSIGGGDTDAELESRRAAIAAAGEQFAYDANQEAWREYDEEDAVEVERGRIRWDENTVRGEVVDNGTGTGHPIYPTHSSRVGGSEFDSTRSGRYDSQPSRLDRIKQRLIEQDEEDRRHGR